MKQVSVIVLFFFILAGCMDEPPTIVYPHSPSLNSITLIAVNGNNSVTLVWGSPNPIHVFSNGIKLSEIRLYRSAQKNVPVSPVNQIATTSSLATQYTDSSALNGITYYYSMLFVGKNPDGSTTYSAPSNVAIGTPYDYSSVTTIDFSDHIQRIFNSGCTYSGCHALGPNGQFPESVDKRSGVTKTLSFAPFLNLTSWDAMMLGGDHGAAIIPFNSAKSHLFAHLNYDTTTGPISTPHMPFTGFNLPDNQYQVLKRWVDEGAQNDVGAVAFSVYPKGKVLVTNQAEDLVAVLDRKTMLVSRYIQAGVSNVFAQPPKAPHNLTVDQVNNCYYIALVVGGSVLKYRLSDNALIGEVDGINSPTQIALTASGDTAFSAQFALSTNAIRMFNTRTMTLYPTLISSPYLNKPHGVQFTPDKNQIWVTGNFSDNIMVVDMSDLSTSIIPLIPNDTIAPGGGNRLQPYETIMSSNGRYVYVSCTKSNEVRVIDRDSMMVTQIIPVGLNPLILDISPNDRYVYVACRNSNSVSVIRTSDNVVVNTIANVGPQPHGIKLSADGKYAYVSCENVSDEVPPHHPTAGSKIPGFLSVIDMTTNTVIQTIEVGSFAAGVAVVE